MKSARLLFALGLLSALVPGLVWAADAPKPAEVKNPEGCDCGKDKEGKVCGVDKDCCCTGQKASKPADKKDDKKTEAKDAKKSG